jgi:hypothetical protein
VSEWIEGIAQALAAEMAEMEPDDPLKYRRLVKAVLSAAREPTEAMVDQRYPCLSFFQAREMWQRMIDAALAE